MLCPCTIASACSDCASAGPRTDAMWLVTYDAAAVAAIVFSSAVPMAPPTCCEVLTMADATPASRGSTP
ncbi:Uncharacterised protein [Mycobacteroides abscessus subsp. abscessus]|nr:Uncharacterised protein [Mycobacteroides abscessus subsp. abscessus]